MKRNWTELCREFPELKSVATLEDHRRGHVHEALHLDVERGPDDGVVEGVVDLGERVGKLVEIAEPR